MQGQVERIRKEGDNSIAHHFHYQPHPDGMYLTDFPSPYKVRNSSLVRQLVQVERKGKPGLVPNAKDGRIHRLGW